MFTLKVPPECVAGILYFAKDFFFFYGIKPPCSISGKIETLAVILWTLHMLQMCDSGGVQQPS